MAEHRAEAKILLAKGLDESHGQPVGVTRPEVGGFLTISARKLFLIREAIDDDSR